MSFRARCYRWKTKYQMEGLKDGEWYNLRDKKVYIKKEKHGKLK